MTNGIGSSNGFVDFFVEKNLGLKKGEVVIKEKIAELNSQINVFLFNADGTIKDETGLNVYEFKIPFDNSKEKFKTSKLGLATLANEII